MSRALEGAHTGRTDILLLASRGILLAAGHSPEVIDGMSMKDIQLATAAINANMKRLGDQVAYAVSKAMVG